VFGVCVITAGWAWTGSDRNLFPGGRPRGALPWRCERRWHGNDSVCCDHRPRRWIYLVGDWRPWLLGSYQTLRSNTLHC